MGTGAVDQDVGELPGLAGAQDVDDPSSCGSSDGLGGILPVPLFQENPLDRPDSLEVLLKLDLLLPFLEADQPLPLHGGGNIVLHLRRLRSRPGAVEKGEDVLETNLFDDLHGLEKILFPFGGKAHDDIGGHGDVGNPFLDGLDEGKVFRLGVASVHEGEDSVRSGLKGEVEGAADLVVSGHHFGDSQGKLGRMGGEKTDPGGPASLGDNLQEVCETAPLFRIQVGVNVLPQENDLFVPLGRKFV